MDNQKKFDVEFRVGTKVEGIEGESRWRNFSIVVIYIENDILTSWAYIYPFHKEENVSDMEAWLDEIKEIVQKPIIDLDNFPHIYENI